MKKNVGNVDMTLRIILGLLIGLAGIYYQSWLGLIGVVPILTAFLNFCPVYTLFGINTFKKASE